MKAKAYLQQASYIRQRMRFISEKIEEIRTSLESTGAIRYDKINVQSTPDPDPMVAHIARMDELTRQYKDLNERYYATLVEIQERINGLGSELYRKILAYRYLDELSFMKIADRMGYTFAYIRNKHGEALVAFSKKYHDL